MSQPQDDAFRKIDPDAVRDYQMDKIIRERLDSLWKEYMRPFSIIASLVVIAVGWNVFDWTTTKSQLKSDVGKISRYREDTESWVAQLKSVQGSLEGQTEHIGTDVNELHKKSQGLGDSQNGLIRTFVAMSTKFGSEEVNAQKRIDDIDAEVSGFEAKYREQTAKAQSDLQAALKDVNDLKMSMAQDTTLLRNLGTVSERLASLENRIPKLHGDVSEEEDRALADIDAHFDKLMKTLDSGKFQSRLDKVKDRIEDLERKVAAIQDQRGTQDPMSNATRP